MLLKEILELVPKEEDSGVIHNNMGTSRDRRGDVDWVRNIEQSSKNWVLKDRQGKTLTKPITAAEAKLMVNRPDLIKRFGKLFPVQLKNM